MKLKSVLFLATASIYAIIFMGTLLLTFHYYKYFLVDQSIYQVQNTASSLSASLSAYAEKQDLIAMETMINALFETGNYANITLHDNKNKLLFQRISKNKNHSVPNWFHDIIHLPVAQSSNTVSNGWKQIGKITVFAEVNKVYNQLWSLTKTLFYTFLFLLFLTLILLQLVLKQALKPLIAVKKQAEAISQRQFIQLNQIPRTIELRSVVLTMNHMSQKIKALFEEQLNLNIKLQEKVYTHPLTQLPNRTYFEQNLLYKLKEKEYNNDAYLFLLEINHVDTLKQEKGFSFLESELKKAAVLFTTMPSMENAFISNLNSHTIVSIQSQLSASELSSITETYVSLFKTKLSKILNPVIAIVPFSENIKTPAQWLSLADLSLQTAKKQNKNYYIETDTSPKKIYTRTEWEEILSNILKTEKTNFAFQSAFSKAPVQNNSHNEFTEVFLRFPSLEKEYSSAYTLPLAETLGFMPSFDKLNIMQIKTEIEKNTDQCYAVNLSIQSISDANFCTWLPHFLKTETKITNRLILECPEIALSHSYEKYAALFQALLPFGVKFSIDQAGLAFDSIKYLKLLPAHYLKIHGSLTQEIEKHLENQFYVQNLVQIAHNLEYKVVALNVETNAAYQCLKTLGVDFYQGYFLQAPYIPEVLQNAMF